MAIDYSKGSVNLRDVSEFVNLIAGTSLLREGRLLRGGKLDFVKSKEDIGSPGTIINLRKSEDFKTFADRTFWFPISNDYEKYDTSNHEVKLWINRIVKIFEDPHLALPVLIHCNTGKDRTGVVVAALLKILEIPEEIIVEEYLLSEGDVREEYIRQALAGIGDPKKYFTRINLDKVKADFKWQ